MIQDKATLLALRPLKTGVVSYEGADIEVRELTAGERDQINAMIQDEARNVWAINAHIAAFGCDCLEVADVPELLAQSSDLILVLSEKISALSGLNEEAVDEAKKT